MIPLPHRAQGYQILQGDGLEIGALHEPSPVPARCRVRYFDAIDERAASRLFPEIPPERFVHVDHLGDLDRGGLAQFRDGQFDFVIINHVLEHLSNPIRTVQEVFRLVRRGGHAVIAIPDKHFTFDRHRALTSFAHLWQDFEQGTVESGDDHYEDFLRSAAPHVFREPPETLPVHLARARERREHTHVWDSASFQAFLRETFARLGIRAELRFESQAPQNQIEYFSVWEKTG